MKYIIYNKLFNSVSEVNKQQQVPAKNFVPLFKNPNEPIADLPATLQPKISAPATSLAKNTSANRQTQQLAFSAKKENLNLLNSLFSVKNNSSETLTNTNFNPSLQIKLKDKLVFLLPKGSQTPNPNIISYTFPGSNTASEKSTVDVNKLMIKFVYKLLFNFFKSMYCLISKPVFINTPDKIKIQLFYFLCIPKILINLTNSFSTQKATYLKNNSNSEEKSLSQASVSTENANRDNCLELKNKSSFTAFKNLKIRRGIKFQLKLRNFNSKDLNVKINLKNLAQSNLTKVYPLKFKLICTILSKLFNKSVELELIRLHHPYYDSNILVNYIALFINKKNIGAAIQKLFYKNIFSSSLTKNQGSNIYNSAYNFDLKDIYYLNQAGDKENSNGFENYTKESYSNLNYNKLPLLQIQKVISPANLSGLNIKISGRLMREPIIPRITTKKFEKGYTAKGKVNYSDVARFTSKNRKGAFTITIKSGQNFN
jgi:hypothetical protein